MTDLATTVTVFDACGRVHVPVLLVSDPGVGKSSLVRGYAAATSRHCAVVLGSIREPADIAGLPVITDAGVVLHPPAWARDCATAEAGAVAFLDELTTCPPSVQAALLTVALDRVVGDLVLPDGVQIIAGANPPDRAADGYELAAPLANRFCHIGFSPTPAEWVSGMTEGWSAPPASRAITADPDRVVTIRASVLGFINARPDLLHVFPADAATSGGAWPSRRTWDFLARSLPGVRDNDHAARQALTFGLVGEGAGIAFLEWVAAADLPSTADVLADPDSIDWTDRPDRVWAILSGVAAWAAATGTKSAWRQAWGPLLACASAGAPDVAAAAARALGRCRPADTTPPARVRTVFGPVLEAIEAVAA